MKQADMLYNFEIYQLGKDADPFKRFESLPDDVRNVNLADEKYELVYQGRIKGESTRDILEEIFYIFNMQHPKDFKGHSLSVSDIAKLNDEYYFCQSAGWKNIECNGKAVVKYEKA